MNRRTAFRIAGAAGLCASAATPAIAQAADPALHQAVTKANSEWAEAMKTGDAAVIAAPYAEHGLFVFPDGSTIQGRDAIEKMYRARFDKRGLATSTGIDSKKLEMDGDLAYEWGSASIGMRGSDGKPVTAGGRYLTVWQRQTNGAWQITRNLVF
jgi:uncharacterized protein (TIGR02246 family)